MSSQAFDKNKLVVDLKTLSIDGQRAFGALCCERLLPNYATFQSETHQGDIQTLRNALDLVWSYFQGRSVSIDQVQQLIDKCELLAPSSDDCESIWVTSAQEACFAVCCLLDHFIDPEPERIAEIGAFAVDSVDLFVQESEGMSPADPNLERKILDHKLMQQELERQISDIATITNLSKLGPKSKEALFKLRRDDEKGALILM